VLPKPDISCATDTVVWGRLAAMCKPAMNTTEVKSATTVVDQAEPFASFTLFPSADTMRSVQVEASANHSSVASLPQWG